MRRSSIGIIVALAMISGWLLRVGNQLFPDWDALSAPVSILFLGIFIEALGHGVDKAIAEGIGADRDDDIDEATDTG